MADRALWLGRNEALLACQLGRSDRFDEARALWREQIAEAYECADPVVITPLVVLACMEVATGGWDEVSRRCDEAIEVARETGWEMGEPAA